MKALALKEWSRVNEIDLQECKESDLIKMSLNGNPDAFGELVRRDGFRLRAFETAFTSDALAGIDVLVIANAGSLPPVEGARSAFRLHEIDALHEWVLEGGALLLVTDHDPAGLPSAALASRFGVAMSHGFAVDDEHCVDGERRSWIEFSRENGELKDHSITNGHDSSGRVERVVAYTGQAMAAPHGSEVFLALAPTAANVRTWDEVDAQTLPDPAQPGVWNAMGVALEVGNGRVVMVSEAAMLTAQVVRNAEGEITDRFGGLNDPSVDGQSLTRNIIRWLAGTLD